MLPLPCRSGVHGALGYVVAVRGPARHESQPLSPAGGCLLKWARGDCQAEERLRLSPPVSRLHRDTGLLFLSAVRRAGMSSSCSEVHVPCLNPFPRKTDVSVLFYSSFLLLLQFLQRLAGKGIL